MVLQLVLQAGVMVMMMMMMMEEEEDDDDEPQRHSVERIPPPRP